MALYPLQAQLPLGQFDGLDADLTTLLGGEVVSLTGTPVLGTDKHTSDTDDGYVGTVTKLRPVVTKTLVSGMRPLFLADEGISGYGTVLGSVVGGSAGQNVTGTVVGPHSTSGSGKVTCWDKPGLYAVSLNAADTTAGTGLVVDHASLAVGAALYATTAGKLTPNVAAAFEAVRVATFVEFTTNGSLVNTPAYLAAALNSPSGSLPVRAGLDRAVIHFQGL